MSACSVLYNAQKHLYIMQSYGLHDIQYFGVGHCLQKCIRTADQNFKNRFRCLKWSTVFDCIAVIQLPISTKCFGIVAFAVSLQRCGINGQKSQVYIEIRRFPLK